MREFLLNNPPALLALAALITGALFWVMGSDGKSQWKYDVVIANRPIEVPTPRWTLFIIGIAGFATLFGGFDTLKSLLLVGGIFAAVSIVLQLVLPRC